MNTELKIDVEDYLSHEEIKDLCREQVLFEIRKYFTNEENSLRILSNLSYQMVFDEIDKVIPNSRELVISKTADVLNDIKSYPVFRDGSYGGKKSLAHSLMETAVVDNKAVLNEKVKETIINSDYSKEIWDRYEEMAETFMSNFYEIVRLGRDNKK